MFQVNQNLEKNKNWQFGLFFVLRDFTELLKQYVLLSKQPCTTKKQQHTAASSSPPCAMSLRYIAPMLSTPRALLSGSKHLSSQQKPTPSMFPRTTLRSPHTTHMQQCTHVASCV
ncbi:unnamed protein product [Amaranthus hypochondriacus]